MRMLHFPARSHLSVSGVCDVTLFAGNARGARASDVEKAIRVARGREAVPGPSPAVIERIPAVSEPSPAVGKRVCFDLKPICFVVNAHCFVSKRPLRRPETTDASTETARASTQTADASTEKASASYFKPSCLQHMPIMRTSCTASNSCIRHQKQQTTHSLTVTTHRGQHPTTHKIIGRGDRCHNDRPAGRSSGAAPCRTSPC